MVDEKLVDGVKCSGQFMEGTDTFNGLIRKTKSKQVTEQMYKEGTKHGFVRVFHMKGDFYTGQYKDGEKTGTWKFYDADGKLVKE